MARRVQFGKETEKKALNQRGQFVWLEHISR